MWRWNLRNKNQLEIIRSLIWNFVKYTVITDCIWIYGCCFGLIESAAVQSSCQKFPFSFICICIKLLSFSVNVYMYLGLLFFLSFCLYIHIQIIIRLFFGGDVLYLSCSLISVEAYLCYWPAPSCVWMFSRMSFWADMILLLFTVCCCHSDGSCFVCAQTVEWLISLSSGIGSYIYNFALAH